MATAVKKVVLAYSGGLDTSIILKWVQETYGCEVVTFTAAQATLCATSSRDSFPRRLAASLYSSQALLNASR